MSLHQTAPENTRTDWPTPDRVLLLVREMGPIGLDPCTSPANDTQATYFFVADGLERDWKGYGAGQISGGGLVFCNPPYGREIKKWIDKCALEGAQGVEIVLLVPANTDTRWYDHADDHARAKCEVRGRLKFKGAPAPAKFGSALFYWGPRPFLFCHLFSALGRVTVLR